MGPKLKSKTAKLTNELDGLFEDVTEHLSRGDPALASQLLVDEGAPLIAELRTNDTVRASIYETDLVEKFQEFASDSGNGAFCLPTGKPIFEAWEQAVERAEEKLKPRNIPAPIRSLSTSVSDSVKLPEPKWPEPLAGEAFHGIAGQYIDLMFPHTEADEAALLLTFLTSIGNLIGAGTFYNVEAADHPARLFTVLAGESSKGRKDSTWNRTKSVVSKVDPLWTERSGLVSGEGLIFQVRDPRTRGEGEDLEVIDEGVADKRCMVIESEFSTMLQVMNRAGNTLSGVLRQAWDNGNLANLARNKGHGAEKSTGAHVSLLGFTTIGELTRNLRAIDAASGFGNRFLYCCCKRSKLLEFGGNPEDADFSGLVMQLKRVQKWSRTGGLVSWHKETRPSWSEVYGPLSDVSPGLFGAVTSRAEAQVCRIALIYAILDQSNSIRREHLGAALAVWEYCEASAEYIWGSSLGVPLADEIVQAFEKLQVSSMTQTEIMDYFGRNRKSDEIALALEALLSHDRLRKDRELTGGRPVTRYHLVT